MAVNTRELVVGDKYLIPYGNGKYNLVTYQSLTDYGKHVFTYDNMRGTVEIPDAQIPRQLRSIAEVISKIPVLENALKGMVEAYKVALNDNPNAKVIHLDYRMHLEAAYEALGVI